MAGNDTQTETASFIITRRMNIIEKLLRMERLSILISVTPATEPESGFVTTIVTVLPGKNIFAMDVSEDAGLNRALQNSGRLIFTATVDGVGMRFEARALITATLRGSPVFAVPIPTSMYWPQQRRSYRQTIPIATPMVCSLLLPDSNPYRFPVLNVSQTGFSLLDENRLIADSIRIGGVLQTCQFSWPRTLDDLFTAELRRTTEVKNAHGILGSAILGLRFVKTTRDFDKQMQDLLHALTRERKRRSELAHQRPAAEALCA